MRAWMHGWKSAYVKRVKYAKDIELAFLRQIGSIGEYGEGYVHA